MDDKTWLLGNINQTGYFRMNYDLHNWKLLIQQLHNNHQVCLLACLSVLLTAFEYSSYGNSQNIEWKFSLFEGNLQFKVLLLKIGAKIHLRHPR